MLFWRRKRKLIPHTIRMGHEFTLTREAAHRIVVELCSLFAQYQNDIRIIGVWVPDLLYPDRGHVGSVDVDMLINHLTLQNEGTIISQYKHLLARRFGNLTR